MDNEKLVGWELAIAVCSGFVLSLFIVIRFALWMAGV